MAIRELSLGHNLDGRGRFRFTDLPPGEYTLAFYAPGFEGARLRLSMPDASWSEVRFVIPCFSWSTPAPPLPLRPEDHQRFPRKHFGFVFETSYGERVDTFKDKVTKDLISDRGTTIHLEFSLAELDSIYEKMIEIRLFEYPESRPLNHGHEEALPDGASRLRARAGGVKRTVMWYWGGMFPSPEHKRLTELIQLIRRIVGRRPEYQALPQARGAYL